MNKLFIIGLPRTGTTSISVALLDYGYSVAHTAFTQHAFELADVVSDAPCFSDYHQLDLLFPDSKFVYLERDLNAWLISVRRLLFKMRFNLIDKSGHFNPVLKRSFYEVFGELSDVNLLDDDYLSNCYYSHREGVLKYFKNREDFLNINISEPGSLSELLMFLGVENVDSSDFLRLNVGKQVDAWKQYKHPLKVNSNSSGKKHRKFFDYARLS